jgi:hypothetical protein
LSYSEEIGSYSLTEVEASLVRLGQGSLPSCHRALPELLTPGGGEAGAVGKVATVWL